MLLRNRHRFFYAMIKFKNITYAYNGQVRRPAVSNLSLTINHGEKLAIMGSNGCGKTTIGMLLSGLIKPQSGEIEIAESFKTDGIFRTFYDP